MAPVDSWSGLGGPVGFGWDAQAGTAVPGLPPSRLWSLRLLTSVVEAKDAYTGGHCRRVHAYARVLGEALGLSNEQLNSLLVAAAYHDVGKVCIVSSILNKPGPLDTREWEFVYVHPLLGRELWEGAIRSRASVAEIIHQHHEHWDGRGYPRKLAGTDICPEARILHVVDAYDAMCSDRPYRPALSWSAILAELHAEAGKQFAPAEVAAFIELMGERQLWAA